MWKPLVVDYQHVSNEIDLYGLSDRTRVSLLPPAIIIRNFYDKKNCQTIVDRTKSYNKNNFQNDKLLHLGPFLMEHVTDKRRYFEAAKDAQKTIGKIFEEIENPIEKIYKAISMLFPGFSVSVATESQNDYSQVIIRMHEKEKSIPIHKDNVRHEGKEYAAVRGIDYQLSCVLHLQESEAGGELIIYDKQWKKEDEKFRNIDFGYSSELVKNNEFCKLSGFSAGDLVVINPNYYHEVTKITGDTSRITLGMFLGFYSKESRIVAWA
ncbi:hypothetical protein [Nitrosopumilus sp.]|uniref:2OG-Fe(II)-dependent halogenase WelO5 family protein n=1 Tax=Nitrosopumilus sp. TaxID=2024843 RepID=UPI003B5A5C60